MEENQLQIIIFTAARPQSMKYFSATVGNQFNYTDTVVTAGITYFYEITANNSMGESSNSNEVNITAINLPSSPKN